MKLTKIILSTVLLIGASHFSDVHAMPSFSDAKKAAASKYQQAKKTAGQAAHTISHSRLGHAASGFGHSIAEKAKSAGNSIRSGANNMKNRLTSKDKNLKHHS